MTKGLDIPWNKYGTITALAERLEDISPQFGRTVLQKMIYILQKVFDVPCGYQYTLYTYGPYCTDLANDLEYVEFLQGVRVDWVNGGYQISPGDKHDDICKHADSFLSVHKSKIDKAIEEFGSKKASTLELIATAIYVEQYAQMKDEPLSFDELVNETYEIKPRYDLDRIKTIINTLIDKNYISIA